MGTGFVALSLVILPVQAPASAQYETPGEIDAALSQTEPGVDLDEATLLDLDELLRDPVRLWGNDVQRLLWIPWITTPQMESLRAALPIHSPTAWGALPHWSEQEVLRLLPFVVFAGPPHARASQVASPVQAQVQVHELRSGRRSTCMLTGGPLSIAAQVNAEAVETTAGFLRWDSTQSQLLIGDLRRTSGLGMMWSSRALSSTAGGSVAMTGSWSGTTSLWRDRVVRGIAARIHTRRGAAEVVRGKAMQGEVFGAQLSWSLPQLWLVQVAALQLHRQRWGSAWLQRGDAQHSVSLEVVMQPVGMAASMHWRRLLQSWRLEASVAAAPHGVSSPLSRVPTSARRAAWSELRLRTSWSKKPLLVRAGWVQTHANARTVRRHNSLMLHTVARTSLLRCEAHYRTDRTEEQDLEDEALGEWQLMQEHRLLLRMVFAMRDGLVSVERRSHFRPAAGPGDPRGIGWRLGGQMRLGQSELDLSAAFFEAVPGASVVFSEPGVGPAPALFYGSSSGMRFAARVRHHWRHVRTSVRGAIGWDPQRGWQPVLEAAVRFRLPGTNAF